MKTITNLTLLLHKLCNQRTESKKQSKSKRPLLVILLIFMVFLPVQKTKADDKNFLDYPYGTQIWYLATNPKTTVEMYVLAWCKKGTTPNFIYCQISDLNVAFSNPADTAKYETLFTFTKRDAAAGGDIFTPYATADKFAELGALSTKNTNGDGSTYTNLWMKWDYPSKLCGKPIRLKISGNWIYDFSRSTKTSKAFVKYVNLVLPDKDSFNPSTIFSFAPTSNSKNQFKWKNAVGASKFILYSDANYTNKIDSVNVVPTSIKDDSIKSNLLAENLGQSHSYYAKQFYNISGPYSGTKFVTYEKKLGQYSHPGYKYPSTVTANPKLNEINNKLKIDLAITEGNTASTLPSKYYIKRNGILLTSTGFTETNYTDATVSQMTDYTYIVYSVPDTWADKSIVVPELSNTIYTSTKPKDISFDSFKFTTFKGTSPYIKISWDNTQWHPENNTIKLYRKNSTTGEFTTDLGVPNTASSYSDFEGIIENKFYTYKFEVTQWGKTTTKIDSVMVVDQVAITKIAATKNTFGDRINLQWSIDRLNLCDRFEIWRSFAFTTSNGDEAWSDEVLVNQFTAQSLLNSWDDRDAAPGTLYKYKVVAIKKTATIPAFDIKVNATDIGFRMPVGVVTGRITYGAGTAVKGTSLYVSSSGTSGDMLYKSLKFSGDNSQGGQVNLKKTKHGCIADKGFTFQAWLQPLSRNAVSSTIFEVGNEYSIRMNSDSILVLLGNTLQQVRSYKLESTIAENSFFHLAVAYSLDKNLKIFINGVAKDSVTLTNTYTCSFNETTTESSLANNTVDVEANRLPFNGNIDDVRLWNRGITNTEAADTYNRYLGGSEIGLIGYWPMDEGIGTYAFDCSKTDKVFNECHITNIKKGTSETVVPKKEQLSIKGVTDADGNYIIRGIPFTGDGSTYSIIPVMGTHTFEPKQQLRYISPSSLIHNSTDFTDKSSFVIKGNILYENTNYPVEDVEFMVDGNLCMRNYKKQVTDANGAYEIDVPIGEHIITPVKNGHVFADAYTDATLKMGLKYNFNVNKTGIDFVDQTKVTLLGRVTGGNVQEGKPIGFNRSKANIGQAEVKIQPKLKQKYTLNLTSNDSLVYNSNDKDINSIAKVKNGDDIITIVTDPKNGEFSIQVPPIPMLVTSVNAGALTSTDFKYGKLPGIDMNPLISSIDTIHAGIKVVDGDTITVVDSCKYHQRMNITYIVPEAEFIISDKNYVWNAFGDSLFNYVDPNNLANNKTISLVTHNDNGTPTYTAGFPVFTQGNYYKFDIVAYEKYINPSTKDSDFVYLKNALFSIENKLSTKPEKTVYALDSLGKYTYKFLVGNPNIITPYTKGMTASIEHNYAVETWKGTLNGIVMGAVPVGGVDFITKGPDQVIAILRDPPGSSSYATLEKGSSVSSTKSYKGIGKESSGHKFVANLGGEQSIGLGLIIKTEIKNDIGAGIEQSVEGSDATSRTESFSFTESISTSSSPDYIGANGDLYIANSSNIGFAKCDQLSLSSTGSVRTSQSYIFVPMGDSTSFRYTQSHIVNTLLPKIKQLRNSLLDTTQINLTSGIKSKYYTVKHLLDADFGESGTYIWVKPSKIETVCIDSVMFYNNQIKNWENIIRENEMEKLFAAGKSPVGNTSTIKYNSKNISFDAGAVLSNSYTRTSSCTKTNNVAWELQAVVTANLGFEVNGFGFTIENEIKAGGGEEKTTEDLTENTVTYSYNLEDGDAGNYFSVDVFTPKSYTVTPKAKVNMNKDVTSYAVSDVEREGGPIFVTRGGNSSCPYEGEDMSLYYKNSSGKSEGLNTATVQIEKPGINVLVPSVSGISSGKQATFDVDLQNYSETTTSCWFQLSVDPASNPRGAIINIDGTPLTEPRLFLVPPKQAVRKTIRLSQSSSDDLKFDSIKLVFESPCDGSIISQAVISASFTPSCSDIAMQIDDRIVNSSTGTDLNIVLKDFDKSYKNFAGIVLQYKGVNELNWRMAKEFVLDSAKMKPSKGFIKIGSGDIAIKYKFPMKDEPDQNYMFRARTVCAGDIYNETPTITVIKDVKTPQSLGLPSPTNGIMTPESDVSLTFNEKIQTEKISASDVSVYGVLNDFVQTDQVGLQFNGGQKAFTESALNLQNGFTIESKVLINSGNTNGTIFTIGEGADKVSLQAASDGLKVLAGTDYSKTVSLTPDDGFQYIALSYDASSKYLSLMLWSNKNIDKAILFNDKLTNGIAPAGRLIVGDNFSGKLRQLSIWSEPRTYTVISSEKSKSKTGNEMNLSGYWPMDEGSGALAADKARSRSLIVNSSWFILPSGKAALLDKTNEIVVKSHHIPLTRNEDFGVEFWFLGEANQPNTSLMSCTNNTDSIGDLQIGFNLAGNLAIETMKNMFIIPSGDVLDNKWHHFALSVLRSGNAQVYIDGAMKYQTASINFGAMSSDSIAFGAKRKFAVGTTKATIDNRFKGAMDEIRLWRCALTGENIRLNKNAKIDGNELGLIAYYPFEKINSSNDVIFDNSDRSSYIDGQLANGGIFKGLNLSTDNTPAIKPARKRVKVLSNFTASDNKLVININEDAARIENCILEFEVERVMDLNENRLASPLKWTAFVDMNRLKWENTNLSLKKEVLTPQTFTAVVVNNSGKYEDFVISGLPAWLSVNKSQGTINPLEKNTLTFTIDQSLNVGAYECAIRLTGSKNIDEVFGVSLKVTGPRPDWTVNPYDYLNSMNVIGQIKIEDVFQEDPEDMLAAFIGTKCVGIVNPQFSKTLNSYIFYMDIYGNTEDEGKSLTFSLWDAGTGRIYPGVDVIGGALSFFDSSIKGSIVSPMIFNATDKVEQQLSIKKGWNWISTNVVNNEPSNLLMKQLQTGLETDGLQIKSQFGSTIISDIGWEGNLQSLSTGLMYLLQSTQPKNVKLIGSTAKSNDFEILIYKKPNPITNPNTGKVTTFQHGWSWVGYVPQFVAPVQEALSGLISNEGDVIKGQMGFATYSGGAWFGSLQYLVPGSGYMYGSTGSSEKRFVYPSQYISKSKVKMQSKEATTFKWDYITGTYPSSMIVNAVVKINDVEMTSTNLQIGAFIDDECRGVIELAYNAARNRYFAYLSVWGSSDDTNKKITFKCYNPTTDKEYVASDKTSDYIMNTTKGTTASPYLISCSTTTDQSVFDAGDRIIYPNPVVNTLNFNYEPSGIELFEIIDATGRTKVYTKVINKNSVNVDGLVPGIYTLRVNYKGENYIHRFIKK